MWDYLAKQAYFLPISSPRGIACYRPQKIKGVAFDAKTGMGTSWIDWSPA
jgi:hypothetical protein